MCFADRPMVACTHSVDELFVSIVAFDFAVDLPSFNLYATHGYPTSDSATVNDNPTELMCDLMKATRSIYVVDDDFYYCAMTPVVVEQVSVSMTAGGAGHPLLPTSSLSWSRCSGANAWQQCTVGGSPACTDAPGTRPCDGGVTLSAVRCVQGVDCVVTIVRLTAEGTQPSLTAKLWRDNADFGGTSQAACVDGAGSYSGCVSWSASFSTASTGDWSFTISADAQCGDAVCEGDYLLDLHVEGEECADALAPGGSVASGWNKGCRRGGKVYFLVAPQLPPLESVLGMRSPPAGVTASVHAAQLRAGSGLCEAGSSWVDEGGGVSHVCAVSTSSSSSIWRGVTLRHVSVVAAPVVSALYSPHPPPCSVSCVFLHSPGLQCVIVCASARPD